MYPNSQDPFFGYPTETPAPRTRNTGAPLQNNPFQNNPYGPQINSDSNNTQSNTFYHHPAPHQQQASSKSDTSTRPSMWGVNSFDPSPSSGRPHVNVDDVPPSTTWPCSSQSLGHNTSIHTGYPFVGQSQAGSQYLDLEPPTTIGGAGHRHSSSEGGITSPQPALLDSDITRGPPTPNSQSITDPSGMGQGGPYGIPPGGIGVLSQQINSEGNVSDMGPSLSSKLTRRINSSASNVAVSKPNVTTTATAEASERRKKTGANFKCTVPGCGSTFTTRSNLKSHLRSHNEENQKPFSCNWPECGRSFARDSDLKRHARIHFDDRPYKCPGCGFEYHRSDGLNRHLQSDRGRGCRKAQDDA